MEEELSKQRGQAGLAVMLVMGGETWMQPWRGPAVPEEEVGSQECQWAKDTWDPQLLAHPPSLSSPLLPAKRRWFPTRSACGLHDS